MKRRGLRHYFYLLFLLGRKERKLAPGRFNRNTTFGLRQKQSMPEWSTWIESTVVLLSVFVSQSASGSQSSMDADLSFCSRRSPVVCVHGCAASSQPLASGVGLGEWQLPWRARHLVALDNGAFSCFYSLRSFFGKVFLRKHTGKPDRSWHFNEWNCSSEPGVEELLERDF